MRSCFCRTVGFVLILLELCAGRAYAQTLPATNLIYDGDFEQTANTSPPPGWTMWGADQWKIPANYTRDTQTAHGGTASFRIIHPAGTGGYVVTDPSHALRPERGRRYTVSFWARSDRNGHAAFGLTAYESLQPFRDAPSPGSATLDVGPDWKRYEFSYDEGWDFFADRSRYLLLTFHAATETTEERTLWIDDVSVTSRPSPRAGRLVDDSTLTYPPLSHRLRPGATLDFTLDPTRVLRPTATEVGGVSFHRVAGWTGQPYDRQGRYTLLPKLETAIRDMRLPMTRLYGVGDEPFPLEQALDRAHDLIRRVGTPEDHAVLEFETQSADTKLSPDVWVRGVRYSRSKGYQFRFWEVSNEFFSSLWGEGKAFPTPDSYVAHFNAVSQAVRAADPQGRIGVSVDPENTKFGNAILKETAGRYDFVVGHYYDHGDVYKRPFEEIVLGDNYRILDTILRTNALIKAYNPHQDVFQYDTEWGLSGNPPDGRPSDYEVRNANIYGVLHRAVRLIYYAREGMLRGASGWQMLSDPDGPGFGILSQKTPDKRFMLYWLYYYFNRNIGPDVLATLGTAPFYTPPPGSADAARESGPLTPVLATRSRDKKTVFVMLANGSWDRSIPCRIHLRRWGTGPITGLRLSDSNPDGNPLLNRKEDFVSDFPVSIAHGEIACTLPPHSVVFLTLRD